MIKHNLVGGWSQKAALVCSNDYQLNIAYVDVTQNPAPIINYVDKNEGKCECDNFETDNLKI